MDIERLRTQEVGGRIEAAIAREMLEWCPVLNRVPRFEAAVIAIYLAVVDAIEGAEGRATENASTTAVNGGRSGESQSGQEDSDRHVRGEVGGVRHEA
jgi:hypothetical protein